MAARRKNHITPKRRLRPVEALVLLGALMQEHGLSDWQGHIAMGGSGDTHEQVLLGFCDFDAKKIFLTVYCVMKRTPLQVRDTILHEIAHALTDDESHGKVWRDKALAIGVRLPEVLRGTMYGDKLAQKAREISRARKRGDADEIDFGAKVYKDSCARRTAAEGLGRKVPCWNKPF